MSAHPVDWHEQCLANQKENFKRKERILIHALRGYARDKSDMARYESQIARSKKLRKEKFDDERFQPETSDSPTPVVENYTHCGVCGSCSTCVRVSGFNLATESFGNTAQIELCYDCLVSLAASVAPSF